MKVFRIWKTVNVAFYIAETEEKLDGAIAQMQLDLFDTFDNLKKTFDWNFFDSSNSHSGFVIMRHVTQITESLNRHLIENITVNQYGNCQ